MIDEIIPGLPNKPKILIIEDDPSNRFIIKKSLDILNPQIEEANEGGAGLLACENQQFDLIICDLMMPGKDGTQFVKEFRQKERSYFCPILILTAIDELESKVSLLEIGCDDYIAKPFEHKELLAKVKVLLRLSFLTRTLSEKSGELQALNKQILELQKELLQQERLEARNTLTATTLHTLRQPLTTAHLSCSLLDKILTTDEQKEKLDSIQGLLKEISSGINALENVDMESESQYVGGLSVYETKE